MYQSNRSLNIPSRATPRAFEFLDNFCSNSPPSEAEKLFKCPIIGPFQVIKCPHPGETFQKLLRRIPLKVRAISAKINY